MEALAHRAVSVRDRELERLRNIISMHVVYSLHSQIGKDQLLTVRELREHRGVEMSDWVEWRPPRTDDVPGMEKRRSNSVTARRVQQPFLDRRLFYPVIAKRLARLRFGGGNDGAVPVDPDGPAVQKQRIAFLERLYQTLRALQREANQIDDDVWSERGDAFAECACRFFCRAVDSHPLHFGPGAMGLVRLARCATNSENLVSGANQPRNQEGTNVSGSADDDDSHDRWAWRRWL